jgi:hypothetical protein
MNRLTAIGLASLVAYGLLIGSKYAGFVSAAREDRGPAAQAPAPASGPNQVVAGVKGLQPLAPHSSVPMPAPVPRMQPVRASPTALEFRASRDLKAFADSLFARRDSLTGDERYYLAKALEECHFAASMNDDLAAYSARQRRQFIAGLPVGDAGNGKRIAAYDAVDSSQRCLRFQGTKIATRDIEELYRGAAMQGDARAQSRMVVAELSTKLTTPRPDGVAQAQIQMDDFTRIVGLLESQDPEAILIVGQFLAQSAMANQLRIGPTGEYPEPSAFLGAFSLVACDLGPDCITLSPEIKLACAHGGYCDAQTFETLYQNFLASPWAYSTAMRYRDIIYNAINTHDWSLLGLQPKASYVPSNKSSYLQQKSSPGYTSLFAAQ